MATSATVSATEAKKRKHVGLVALLSAGFILTGFPTIIAGPILPTFISRWNLTRRLGYSSPFNSPRRSRLFGSRRA